MLALIIPNDSNLDVVKKIKHAKVLIVTIKNYSNGELIEVPLNLKKNVKIKQLVIALCFVANCKKQHYEKVYIN